LFCPRKGTGIVFPLVNPGAARRSSIWCFPASGSWVSTPVPALDSRSSISAAQAECTCKLCCNFRFPCEFCPAATVFFLLLRLGVAPQAELGFSLRALRRSSWCADSFYLSGFLHLVLVLESWSWQAHLDSAPKSCRLCSILSSHTKALPGPPFSCS
jgi:hypothetical protein